MFLKRSVVLFLVIMVTIVWMAPAIAFFDSGEIEECPGLEFDDIEVRGSGKVLGIIENHTDEFVRFSGTLLFMETGNKVVADAFVANLDIPADGEASFDTWLLNGNARDADNAFKIRWVKCWVR